MGQEPAQGQQANRRQSCALGQSLCAPPAAVIAVKLAKTVREQASKTLQPLDAKEGVLPGGGRPRADGA